jgi:chromate transporter
MNALTLAPTDWLQLLLHFATLSMLGVGGAITTLPDMHRYLVDRQHWLLDSQFNASVALAQAAPGPNILFVALMGWHVGLNAGGGWLAPMGALITIIGILLPSSVLTYAAGQWSHRNRELRAVRAFKQGLAPTVVGLLIATGLILATAGASTLDQWPVWLIAALSTLLVWRTRLHILWLLSAGALIGVFVLA